VIRATDDPDSCVGELGENAGDPIQGPMCRLGKGRAVHRKLHIPVEVQLEGARADLLDRQPCRMQLLAEGGRLRC
jgi:hypothetical protein